VYHVEGWFGWQARVIVVITPGVPGIIFSTRGALDHRTLRAFLCDKESVGQLRPRAFSEHLTNFLMTKCTSPLTLQVLGNAKGAVAVVVSIIIFRNPVSGIGMFGYGITIAGVGRTQRPRNGERRGAPSV